MTRPQVPAPDTKDWTWVIHEPCPDCGFDLIATAIAAVDGTQWQRTGRRDNGSVFTVDTFAGYFLHDRAHHAWDVSARPAG